MNNKTRRERLRRIKQKLKENKRELDRLFEKKEKKVGDQ